MINSSEIIQTLNMFNQQHLDIRTITMGISLLDCADPDPKAESGKKRQYYSDVFRKLYARRSLLWCSEGDEHRTVSDVYDYSEWNRHKDQAHDWFREWTEKKSGTV